VWSGFLRLLYGAGGRETRTVLPAPDERGRIEGLAKTGELHPVQAAFVEHDALQCGFCTPGMILAAFGLLLANPRPTRQQILDHMEDNLCRCGAHNRIVRAIEAAAAEMRKGLRP
jgi:aerobic-type carbon monoxide dehydrogenase small subunit (CoxS/CutS family)